ncbi:UDP-N-acetylmuramoyl-L-alanyl-D-glutamate--2,6-diaminopimelate ligase [Campylobacterota bacterium]|nr:UDP-N-acetylmuramoyl-L-alanyl-D-glutamate--2,6-diaminopimelate ligase [Campylobacterota bacterium]
MRYPVTALNFKFITADSRECDADCAFLVDWYSKDYVEDAVRRGAAAVLHAADLKRYFNTNIPIVGITGTNGKTTTAALIYSLLLDLGFGVAMQGTRGFFLDGDRIAQKGLTTPMLLENYARIDEAKRQGADFFITEVSSHAIAQGRMEGINFALKIHTNITGDHLDFHKTFAEYRAVKNSFFADESPKLINKDDELVEYNLKNARTYAVENSSATFKLEAYTPRGGLSGIIRHADKKAMFKSLLVGRFNLYNITAGVAAVKMLTNASLETICGLVENFGGVSGRMEVVSEKPQVVVDFAHTPDGIEKALRALHPSRLVVVFGAGGDRDKAKRPLMGGVVARYAAKIIITTDNPRSENPADIIAEIEVGVRGHPNTRIIDDRKKAIETALSTLDEGEILVILGKGDETTQIIGDEILPFSDREVVLDFLGRR